MFQDSPPRLDVLEQDFGPVHVSIEMDGRKMKIRDDQVTTSLLGKVFCLLPDSVVLLSDTGEVEIPTDGGYFTFSAQ